MIDKINNKLVQNLLPKPGKQSSQMEGVPNNDADASLQINYASIIDKAAKLQINENDAEAVKQARNLLMSGKLETPENIKAAAENIIDFGI